MLGYDLDVRSFPPIGLLPAGLEMLDVLCGAKDEVLWISSPVPETLDRDRRPLYDVETFWMLH